MAQVSIGQVENLEDLVRGLQSVREALETACREQIAVAATEMRRGSRRSAEQRTCWGAPSQQEQAAQQKVQTALSRRLIALKAHLLPPSLRYRLALPNRR